MGCLKTYVICRYELIKNYSRKWKYQEKLEMNEIQKYLVEK